MNKNIREAIREAQPQLEGMLAELNNIASKTGCIPEGVAVWGVSDFAPNDYGTNVCSAIEYLSNAVKAGNDYLPERDK